MQAYRQAAKADPAYFEAYYNLGFAAYDAKAFQQALSAYESALAINPFSVDARFNFALTLRDGGYLLDAVAELERLLAANPTETRAHYALGNLYAQKLRQPAAARQQYLRVLELEPQHPQATAIRYWLAANPG
jgi:tetratricopeptide (TPR) repeat protein